jgi:hypothetical protein
MRRRGGGGHTNLGRIPHQIHYTRLDRRSLRPVSVSQRRVLRRSVQVGDDEVVLVYRRY